VEPSTIIPTILALLSGIIGIYSALRSHGLARDKLELERQQARNDHRASLIDDIEQVLNSVKQENGRLAGKVDDLKQTADHQAARIGELEVANRALIRSNDRLADRVEELEAAYKVETEKNARLTQRVEELESELARLGHLRDNVP